jgi:hypothetical protein
MNEDEFIRHVKKTLDQRTEALDAETLSRLNRARQTALQQAGHKAGHSLSRAWVPLGGVAAAILLTSIFMFKTEEMATLSDSPVDEIEIIASSDNLDLYEQLDFYLWLLEEDSGAV